MKTFEVIGVITKVFCVILSELTGEKLSPAILRKKLGSSRWMIGVRYPDLKKFGEYGAYLGDETFLSLGKFPITKNKLLRRLANAGEEYSIDNCQAHIHILACGCKETMTWGPHLLRKHKKSMPCPTCGGYTSGNRRKKWRDEYEDCDRHDQFFKENPDIFRWYASGCCPQLEKK